MMPCPHAANRVFQGPSLGDVTKVPHLKNSHRTDGSSAKRYPASDGLSGEESFSRVFGRQGAKSTGPKTSPSG